MLVSRFPPMFSGRTADKCIQWSVAASPHSTGYGLMFPDHPTLPALDMFMRLVMWSELTWVQAVSGARMQRFKS